ncbi:MAG TPA: PQQ-dependent sugar dehydrogenase [Candidatus Limnocylindria bacterium]|nr:PQQ-dependent sugar dehydrogenase [Candidatus Limnocylindria bacterium]
MKKGILIVFGSIALIVVVLAGLLVFRFQRSLAPAPDNAPAVSQGVGGIPELTEEVVLSGLSNVWDVGFLPNETLIFTERAGTISKISQGKKAVLHTISNIYARGEGGLLGMAVDPDFASNRYVYACYNTPRDIRVSRWKVNDDATALGEQKDIVTGMPVNTGVFPGRHSGCRPRFGADGFLWIGTGDTAAGTTPQDPRSLGGKVLRVDRDGKAAPGNLGGAFDPRIFNYGHRNVQGLAMYAQPKNGLYGYSVEHGPDKDDEINPLRPGNMGWNPVPLYNELVPMTDKKKYPNAIDPIWTSGGSTIAPSGMTFISGKSWKGLEGRLAMAVLKNQHVRILDLDDSGKVKSQEVLFEKKYGRIRSVVMGPGDSLYLATDNGDGQDEIIKVTPR